jgi:hypothetical protein
MSYVEEVGPGSYVVAVPAPVTPADLVEIATGLPPGVIMESIEQDHDGTVYVLWQSIATYGRHSVEPFDWTPPTT